MPTFSFSTLRGWLHGEFSAQAEFEPGWPSWNSFDYMAVFCPGKLKIEAKIFARAKTMKSPKEAILLYQWSLNIFFCLHCTWVTLYVAFRKQSDRNKTVQPHMYNKLSSGISARTGSRPELKFLPCNCSLYFTIILFIGRAEVSGWSFGLAIKAQTQPGWKLSM